MTSNTKQVGGDHYKSKAIQPWDYIASNNIGYLEGNVIKYVSRWKDKNGVQDLEKARHYLDKLIELQSEAQPDITIQSVIDQHNDGWIEWRGGECPLPAGTIHEVKFRSGEVVQCDNPTTWAWGAGNNGCHISAYRVVG